MSYTSEQIKNSAYAFLIASDISFEERKLPTGQIMQPIVPAVVCTAFGIELYLKAIINLEKGTAKGHDLYELFLKLSSRSKNMLAKKLNVNETGLETLLKDWANCFVEWRYVYEKSHIQIETVGFRNLLRALSILYDEIAASTIQ